MKTFLVEKHKDLILIDIFTIDTSSLIYWRFSGESKAFRFDHGFDTPHRFWDSGFFENCAFNICKENGYRLLGQVQA